MTLMSKTHYKFRYSLACFVALLQFAVVPATYCLHLECDHSHSDGHYDSGIISAVVSCFSGHDCDCSHDTSDDCSDSESPPPVEPHDSNSCPVCQAAFATSTADFYAPKVTETETVSVLSPPAVNPPASATRYRSKSRGPPRCVAVS